MQIIKYLLAFIFLLVIWSNCSRSESNTLFLKLEPAQTGIDFANHLSATDSLIALSFEYLFNGAGVAISDFNNDGLPDVFFTGNMVSSRLYLNKGQMQFEDVTDQANLNTKGKWLSGATAVDINQDGWMDIYVCAGGLSTAPEKRSNLLFINQQDGTFTEEAKTYGIADAGYSINALFFDYDQDADLDLYVLTTELDPYNWSSFKPRRLNGEAPNTDRLYRNNGDNTFTDVSKQAGIQIEGYGLGIAVNDFNNDGWMDLFVANDFLSNDVIYINNGVDPETGEVTFTDHIEDYFSHSSRNSMGVDIQDFNNDGLFDLMVLDMLPVSNARRKSMFGFFNYDKFQLGIKEGYLPQYPRNTLQMNNGKGTFSEVAQLAGVDQTDWSWTTLFADFDNDGLQDLLVTNGYRQDITNMDFATYSRQLTSSPIGTDKAKEQKMFEKLRELPEIKTHNYLFKNPGHFPFEDKSTEWGFDIPSYSNGGVYSDLDNDGDLDIIINNIDAPAFVYENQAQSNSTASSNHYLRIQLIGESPNQQAIGAKVEITYGQELQVRRVSPYRGYLSTVENVLHFGLGQDSLVNLKITWPDGKEQWQQQVTADQLLKIKYAPNNPPSSQIDKPIVTLFEEVSQLKGLNFTHEEEDFIDFKIQPILPHKHSQSGPALAVGDINGDGLDDLYIGGSAGKKGELMIQTAGQNFSSIPHTIESGYHDMGCLFFDAEGDGDLDLYIVSGGTFATDKKAYQDRLYLNDNDGNFSLAQGALPVITSSGASVSATDYDRDGDLDLLVTGRIVPGAYPNAAKSYLLKNESTNGLPQFTDQSAMLPDDGALGLACQALWTDYDNDGWTDICLVGEWLPITFLKNNSGKFTPDEKIELPNSTGWWNSIVGGDFDKDGDTDYVIGNLGLNTFYKASKDEPVSIYANDFDRNGRLDPVLTHYTEGKEYIAASRDMLISQINAMRSRFKTYAEYGAATLDRSFTKDELGGAEVFRSKQFATSYIENLGNGKFDLRPMPQAAQVAPIFGMLTEDVNGDGHMDVLMVGNDYSTEIMIGRYDACKGIVLLGDSKGGFEEQTVLESGFLVDKDAKALVRIADFTGDPIYIASRNRSSLRAFNLNENKNNTIPVSALETHAFVKLSDGSTYRTELYTGSSYLSQSSRDLVVPGNWQEATIYDVNDKERTVRKK